MNTQTQTNQIAAPKPTNGSGAQMQPAPLNVAPLPPAVKIPSHEQPAPRAPAPVQMTDAPYSWTLTALDPNGFSEMFTVRAVTAEGFYARVQQMKSNLLDFGYKPTPVRGTSTSAPASASTNATDADAAPLCAIHKTPLAKRTGPRGTFYSCPHKLDDGSFCPYKPKQ